MNNVLLSDFYVMLARSYNIGHFALLHYFQQNQDKTTHLSEFDL